MSVPFFSIGSADVHRSSQPVLQIRPFKQTESIDNLTLLLHRAYSRLGGMGLNYTAVNQKAEVTAERLRDGICFVAVINS